MKTVLISGAGVAGPALAYWLHHHGFRPTVVERAPSLRAGGHAVDVRGTALDVIDRMGLTGPLRDARTEMRGMSMLDADGVEIMRSTEMALSSGRLDSDDVEVLREDLSGMLADLTRPYTRYLFGDSVTALEQGDDDVRVTFGHAAPETFDLVVGADGLHSTVRRLAFGPEERYLHHLGAYVGVFTAPNFLGLDRWQVWLRTANVGYGIYSARGNTEIRANLGFESGPLDYDRHDVDAQRTLVEQQLTGVGWETPRLLAAMWQADDFYFDAMAQTRMDRWSAGRVTLLGDAGYCPSPLSGQGTSLALVGAYVLADALARAGGDHRAGFARYEQRMRGFVTVNQALATENPGGPPSEESAEAAKSAIALDDLDALAE
ncbi:FAD-dependent monooxygenase [Actinoplanes rectilineatus]|uniref:FAD-dependent monooxygenase n=1 Tax=Actinoplanes rectilineatus TaxID=113571 RepID=UPI0005F2AC21|nr:FAD-dependent monooxygenase [Actinoplanes rectilineatus]